MPPRIEIDQEKLAAFCKKWHIRKLWLFGSVLRDDFTENSDVDVLYEFEDDQIVGFKIFDIEKELSRILDLRRVDLVDIDDLSPRISSHSSFFSELVYDKG